MAAREATSEGECGAMLGPADEVRPIARASRGTAVEGANEADGPVSSL